MMRAARRRGLAVVAALLAVVAPACKKRVPSQADAASTPRARGEIASQLFLSGWRDGWQDGGWCPRETLGAAPASVHFAHRCGWMLAKPGPALAPQAYGALVFRVKPPAGAGDFLELRLESSTEATFPRVKVRPDHRTEAGDGWYEVSVPLVELDPDETPFDRVVLRAHREIDDAVTEIDDVALTKADGSAAGVRATLASYAPRAKPVTLRIACDARATKISPLIYGIAFYALTDEWASQWAMGATARRFGGNTTSTYNWEIGAWNVGADWYFENKSVPHLWEKFLDDGDAHDMVSAVTVPMLGWVAKDGTSVSFPVSVYGPQGKADPSLKEAGDGTTPEGKVLTPGPPTRTSVAASPEWVKRWIEAIRARDAKKGKRSVYEYILDNEPMVWNKIHRDVRPEPLGYDELFDRTVQYATAIRQADPDAQIAGPAEWGWTNYFHSAKDGAAGFLARPDRRAHGDTPLVEWYLKKLREHEAKTGTRLLDVLDLHFYPAAEHIYGASGGVDPKTSALRLRQTRGLWDPKYKDESWIKEPVMILPRMRAWVDANYPGRGISIGEWNFGGEGHISGALAIAEALGRFAQYGVTSAFYWTYPPDGAPSIQGFVAYRNFDGKGGHFLEGYLPTAADAAGEPVSLFASCDASGEHLVAVAINMSADEALLGKLELGACSPVLSRSVYTFMRGMSGFADVTPDAARAAGGDIVLAPWSITVVDVRLSRAMPGAFAP